MDEWRVHQMVTTLLDEAPDSARNLDAVVAVLKRELVARVCALGHAQDLFYAPAISEDPETPFLEDGCEGTKGVLGDLLERARGLAFTIAFLKGLSPHEHLVRRVAFEHVPEKS